MMTLHLTPTPTTAGKLVAGHAEIQMMIQVTTTTIGVEERRNLPEQLQKRKFHSIWLKKLRERFQLQSKFLISYIQFHMLNF